MIRKVKNYYHLFEAILINILYNFPSRKLTVIGVTGTDGKTTTSSLIYHILKTAGKDVALISTVGAYIGEKSYDTGFHVTTPSPFMLQKYIRKVANQRSEYLILEITSHALDQYRAYGIRFEIGVITNVTHEHLDYHKTYENYVLAKAKLLKMANVNVINKDDESYQYIKKLEKSLKSKKIITYGLSKDSEMNPIVFPFTTSLVGEFNTYNCLAAATVCRELGLDNEHIRNGIRTFKAPLGRQEIVYDKDFSVMIDFAHTPHAIASILECIRKFHKGRLIHVFGSAGKRDATKRPLMGEASSKYADIIILTAEDPRGERVEKINNEIESGIRNLESRTKNSKFEIRSSKQIQNLKQEIKKGKKYVFEIPDRKQAIEFAIQLAEKGDFVVITGKGHEKSMNLGNGEELWNEHEVVKEALAKRS